MKKVFVLLTGLLLLASCGNKQIKKDYNVTIDGTAPGLDNVDVKLITYKGQKKQTLDSLTLKQGHFTIGAKVDKPVLAYLIVSGIPSDLPLILEPNQNIKVDLSQQHLRKSAVISKGLNKKLFDYFDKMSEFSAKQQRLAKLHQAATQKGTKAEASNILSKYYAVNDEKHEYEYNFISHNKDNMIGGLVFETITFDKAEPDFNKLLKLYNSFSDDVKQMNNVKNALNIIKSKTVTSIGSVAPDFSAPTPDGKMLSLKDAKGKVTVIDFWASWCRPCRAENPYVLQIYKKYHDKGLNIIGVSLDKPNNKAAWVQAIKDDGLIWQHVSNLKFWNDPIARQLYGVKSIPQTFILDEKGVIRAKNLRRDQLEAKIKELLDEQSK